MNVFETLRAIRDLRDVSGAHKAILYAMVLRTDGHTRECWPSYPTLAVDAGVSLALAKRAVKELERLGHIAVSRCRVEGTGWSQVNRYVVQVGHDAASKRDDVVSPRDHGMPQRDRVVHDPRGRSVVNVMCPRDDAFHERQEGRLAEVVSLRDDVVQERQDGFVPEVVSKQDDVVHERDDDRARDVVSKRHDVVHERDDDRAQDGVSKRHDLVHPQHEESVMVTRRVVSERHDGRIRVTSDLPNELPNGRSFALARPDEPVRPLNHGRKKEPRHAPELIAAKNAVVAEFVLRCEVTKGSKPKKIHERDHAAAFALAKTYGAAEGRSIVRRAFEDDFVLTKNTTLAFIESKAETYRGNVIQRGKPQREIQALVGDEPWFKEHRT